MDLGQELVLVDGRGLELRGLEREAGFSTEMLYVCEPITVLFILMTGGDGLTHKVE